MPAPMPQSNTEKYLSVIAGHSTEVPSEPASRVEWFLNEIVENGGIGGKLVPKIVNALPATGESGILYLVPSQDGSGRNVHNEYIWIEDESKFELLGQTTVDIDLSGYVPNSRKVGGKPLSADVGISVTASNPLTIADNSDASNVAFSISHKDSGVTAGSKGDTTNQTPGFGETFKTLSETVDAKGHVTTLTEHTVKIPDTKVTTSADGLMAKEDKAKLDQYVSKGSTTKGVYIDASGSPQPMAHELNADIPVNFAPAAAAPLMDGTATVGNSVKYAHEDHVHPTDTSRASAADVTALESENALLRELINGIDAPIYRTASGNPATFSDGYAADIKELIVTLTPTQAGSGDPYPPGGGKNLLPLTLNSLKAHNTTGTWSGNIYTFNGITFTVNTDADDNVLGITMDGQTTTSSTVFILCNMNFKGGVTYLLSGASSNAANMRITISKIGSDAGRGYTYTPAADDTRRLVHLYADVSSATLSGLTFRPMVRRASDTDPTFAPYSNVRPISGVSSVSVTRTGENGANPQTVTVQLTNGSNPLTVYGGTLNVTTGELTVTWVCKTFDGSETIVTAGESGRNQSYYLPAGLEGDTHTQASNLVSHGKWHIGYGSYGYNYNKEDFEMSYPGGGSLESTTGGQLIFLGVTKTQTADDFRTWLTAQYAAGTPVQVVYSLATLVTYQLTPAQLATLSGYNAVSTDAGTLSVTYRADPALSLGGSA